MKSRYVDMLLKVVKGILTDAQHAYTNDGSFVKDLTTLTRLSNDRGLGLFQLDLPHLDDLLTQGLKDGRLILEGALSKRVSKRVQVPRLFSGLWLRLFDEVGCLKQDVDANAVLFLRQLCCIGKKVKVPCSEDRMRKTVNEYESIDQGLRSPTLSWDSDSLGSVESSRSVHFCDIVAVNIHDDEPTLFAESDPIDRERSSELLQLLQRAADSVCSTFELFNPISESCRVRNSRSLGRGFKHGPGAVAHTSGIVDKYYWRNLSKKLLSTFPRIYYVPKGIERDTCNHEVPARLIAVSKTAKAPRLIAAEPVEHQFAQQLMLGWFNHQFNKSFQSFISLDCQENNQELALIGSQTGQLATVDLSSASDRLSCWTVERIFRSRPDILRALHSCRTRWLKNEIRSTTPYFLKLKKYASQGTACTFPVQSLVFLVIAMAACGYDDYKAFRRQMSGRVRIYGDDIILPSINYARLSELLTLCQLKVNHQKSFFSGNFRESCGGDYFHGYDVTPVKVTRLDPTKPEGRQSLLDASNNFFKKGFWHTAEAVGYLLPAYVRKNLPVVSVTSGSPGLTSFVGSWYNHLPLRWDSNTSSVKYRFWGTSSKTPSKDRDGTSRLLKYLNEASAPSIFGYAEYNSDLSERGQSRDRLAWRALEPFTGFRANRRT